MTPEERLRSAEFLWGFGASVNDIRRAFDMAEERAYRSTPNAPYDNQFVDQWYVMHPDTEELLYDGSELKEGMRVLIGDRRLRLDLTTERPASEYYHAMQRNRWCIVSKIELFEHQVIFLATYDDGTKFKRTEQTTYPWLVKKNTLYIADPSYGIPANTKTYTDSLFAERPPLDTSPRAAQVWGHD
jgi:hypothetical protein